MSGSFKAYTCTIKGFKTSNYGKYGSEYDDTLIFMELGPYFEYAVQYIPDEVKTRVDFVEYLL